MHQRSLGRLARRLPGTNAEPARKGSPFLLTLTAAPQTARDLRLALCDATARCRMLHETQARGAGRSRPARAIRGSDGGERGPRSLVRKTRNRRGEGRDPLIVASVIALAHKLNIRVVAEGVESERQRIALKELGCDCAQATSSVRAVPAAEASLLLLIAAARRNPSAGKPSRCRPPERDTVRRHASGMTLRSRRRGAVADSKDKESDLLFKGEGPAFVMNLVFVRDRIHRFVLN
jgi:hypothetical protein